VQGGVTSGNLSAAPGRGEGEGGVEMAINGEENKGDLEIQKSRGRFQVEKARGRGRRKRNPLGVQKWKKKKGEKRKKKKRWGGEKILEHREEKKSGWCAFNQEILKRKIRSVLLGYLARI